VAPALPVAKGEDTMSANFMPYRGDAAGQAESDSTAAEKRLLVDPRRNAKDLPAEVANEVFHSSHSAMDLNQIFMVYGGTLNVDEVIVGFWKLLRKKRTRRQVAALLARQRRDGALRPTGVKGEYTIDDLPQ
jgi:hypothetical protein